MLFPSLSLAPTPRSQAPEALYPALILATSSSFPSRPRPSPRSRSNLAFPKVARGLGVGVRPCEASRVEKDKGEPATPGVPAVDPGLHGSSSRISPCILLILAAKPTPGSGSLAGGERGSLAERKRTARGGGAPQEAGPGNRPILSLLFCLSRADVYPRAGRRRPRPPGPGKGGRGGESQS